MSLGTTIARLRTEKSLSQGELADALGVSRQSISKWETDGSVPELDKLVKLARLFGVTLDQLVLEGPPAAEPPPPEPPSRETAAPPPSRGLAVRQIIGILLLSMGGLLTLVLTALGGFLVGLILASPLFLCGAVCLLFRRRAGLWCGWTLYLLADLYLRFATGINWRLALHTLSFTPEQNYMRLATGWGQLLGMLALVALTVFSFRKVCLPPSQKHRRLLIAGWAVFLVMAAVGGRWFWNRWFAYALFIHDDLLLLLFTALLTATLCLRRAKKTD